MYRKSFLQIFILGLILPVYQFASAQFIKQWEFLLEGNGRTPISYSINERIPLKTFQTTEGDFIAVSLIENGLDIFPKTIYVYRFDRDGLVKWEFKYQTKYGINEDVFDATMDPYGNILVGAKASTYYSGGFEPIEASNALLLKIDANGQLIWEKESPTPMPFIVALQRTVGVCTDMMGSVYTSSNLSNQEQSTTSIEKWSPAGDSVWRTNLPYSYSSYIKIVDNKLIVIFPGNPSSIYHFSLDGALLFSNEIPRIPSGKRPTFDQDGNWYTLASTGKFAVEKRSIKGDILWTYQKPSNLPPNVLADEIEDCTIDDNGNVYLTGRYYGPEYGDTSLYSNCDILTIKIKADGTSQWENLYQFSDLRSCQVAQRILFNQYGQVLIAGYQSVRQGDDPYYSSDMLILSYDLFGHRIDSVYYNGLSNKKDVGVNIIQDENAIYLLGWTQQKDDLYDQVVIKYEYQVQSATPLTEPPEELTLFPNPIGENGFVIMSEIPIGSLDLCDITGRKIWNLSDYEPGSWCQISPEIPDGFYLLNIRFSNHTIVKRFIIQRR